MFRSHTYSYPAHGRKLLAGHAPVAAALNVIQDPLKLIGWVAVLALAMSAVALIMASG